MTQQPLHFFEKWFSIFSFIFLTGILRWSSLFVSPDPRLVGLETYNPFDSVSSLIQYVIYSTTFLLLIARGRSSIQTAIRSSLVWSLLGIVLVSFLWSDFPDWSLRKGFATLQTTSFGLYIASRFSIKQQLHLLAWALGLVAILSLLFSLSFPGAAIEAGANAGAWRGPFTQKNLLARLMLLGSIVFLLLTLDKPRKRFLVYGGFGLCILLLLLSTSKTALVLLLMLMTLVPFYKALRWKGTVLIPFLITVILIIGSIAVLVIANWEDLLLALGRDPTLSGRTGLWQLAIQKISERPWLGYGYQGFWQSRGEAEMIWRIEGYKPPHAHNGFINIALDLGIIGLTLFLLTIVSNYFRSIRWLRSGDENISLWPILYITFFFVYNYTENTIIEQNSIFWTLLVIVVLSLKRSRYSFPIQHYEQEAI